jgi:hypothetical protein
MDHQVRVVQHMRMNRGLIMAHEMGSGKTLTALAVMEEWLAAAPGNRVIFVAKAILFDNLKKQADDFGLPIREGSVVHLTPYYFSVASQHLALDAALVVVDEAHFLRTPLTEAFRDKRRTATLRRLEKRWNRGRKIAVKLGLLREPVASKPDLSVYTSKSIECNIGCEALACLHGLRDAAKVLLMTGTPMPDTPFDLANLIVAVRPRLGQTDGLVINRRALSSLFAEPSQADGLKRLMGGLLSHYKIPDDAKGYPRIVREPVEVIIEEEAIGTLGMNTLLERTQDSSAFYARSRKASNVTDGKFLKGEALVRILQANPGKRTLIFSNFVGDGVGWVEEALVRRGIDFFTITGKTKEDARRKAVAAFNKNADGTDLSIPSVFVMSVSVGGEGIDFKRIEQVILLDPCFAPGREAQLLGRARRKGSDHTVVVYSLVTVLRRNLNTADQIVTHQRVTKTITIGDAWQALKDAKVFIENEVTPSNDVWEDDPDRPALFGGFAEAKPPSQRNEPRPTSSHGGNACSQGQLLSKVPEQPRRYESLLAAFRRPPDFLKYPETGFPPDDPPPRPKQPFLVKPPGRDVSAGPGHPVPGSDPSRAAGRPSSVASVANRKRASSPGGEPDAKRARSLEALVAGFVLPADVGDELDALVEQCSGSDWTDPQMAADVDWLLSPLGPS